MSTRRPLLQLKLSRRFEKSYANVPDSKQSDCADAIESLQRGETSSGLRTKPIMPSKYFYEARVNSGDRIIFRREGDTLLIHDVVLHDDIERFGKPPKKVR